MSTPPAETHVPTPADLRYEVVKCTKTYKSKTGLTNHVASVHQILASNVLSPLAVKARTLFSGLTESEDMSTQGNRLGRINYPEVVSAASILCGICDNEVNNSEGMTEHMAEKHDKAETDKTRRGRPR